MSTFDRDCVVGMGCQEEGTRAELETAGSPRSSGEELFHLRFAIASISDIGRGPGAHGFCDSSPEPDAPFEGF